MQIIYQGNLLNGKNYSQELDQGVVFLSYFMNLGDEF